MSFLRTLLLTLLAGAVGAYIWFVEAPRMEDEARPHRVLEFSPADIAALDLSYPDGSRIHVVRTPAGWRMTVPVDYAADQAAVENFLRAVEELEIERTLETDEALDLDAYGLAGAGTQGRVALTKTDGTLLPAVLVGKTTPVAHSAFVRLENSERVFVTPLLFHSTVKKTALDLRDKRLFDIAPNSVIGIRMTAGTTDVRIVRRGNDWDFVSPFEDRADTDAVRSLINAANDALAEGFVDGDQVDRQALGLAEPFLRVGYQLGGDTSVRFALGTDGAVETPAYYLERASDGQIAKVPDWLAGRFSKHPNELRNRLAFRCDAATARSLAFSRPGRAEFRLTKGDGGEWTVAPTAERAVSAAAVNRVLRGLSELEGDAIAGDLPGVPNESLTEYGLQEPLVTVSVTAEDGTVCAVTAAKVEPTDETGTPTYYFRRDALGPILSGQSHHFSRLDFTVEDFLVPSADGG